MRKHLEIGKNSETILHGNKMLITEKRNTENEDLPLLRFILVAQGASHFTVKNKVTEVYIKVWLKL